MPPDVLFGRELQQPCDLQFHCKPDDDVVGEDYVSKLKRQMEAFHERVHNNMLGASNQMKQPYEVRAEKEGYVTEDVVWLCNPRRRCGYSPKLQNPCDGP